MSADSLETIRPSSLSQRTGTLMRPSYSGSVARYASLRKSKPLMSSVKRPPVNAHPRSSRYGSA